MGKLISITCDCCEKDIKYWRGSMECNLILTYAVRDCEPGPENAITYGIPEAPPIDRDYYFCNLKCLDKWREGNKS